PRKPPEISNYQFLCALLYMIENGCKWRALPKKYGKWHTIYGYL
ncbi:MAG: transposase, partial [Alphaproteobacteria bacterium]|nr:transposase [Alphaproteobacteria bacterium]